MEVGHALGCALESRRAREREEREKERLKQREEKAGRPFVEEGWR